MRATFAALTLWQRQTPPEKAETADPRLETFLSPGRGGSTSQSGCGKRKRQDTGRDGGGVFIRVLTDLLKAGSQVAAEDVADPVYLHPMEAGLGIALLHSLQVSFLLEEKSVDGLGEEKKMF